MTNIEIQTGYRIPSFDKKNKVKEIKSVMKNRIEIKDQNWIKIWIEDQNGNWIKIMDQKLDRNLDQNLVLDSIMDTNTKLNDTNGAVFDTRQIEDLNGK